MSSHLAHHEGEGLASFLAFLLTFVQRKEAPNNTDISICVGKQLPQMLSPTAAFLPFLLLCVTPEGKICLFSGLVRRRIHQLLVQQLLFLYSNSH